MCLRFSQRLWSWFDSYPASHFDQSLLCIMLPSTQIHPSSIIVQSLAQPSPDTEFASSHFFSSIDKPITSIRDSLVHRCTSYFISSRTVYRDLIRRGSCIISELINCLWGIVWFATVLVFQYISISAFPPQSAKSTITL